MSSPRRSALILLPSLAVVLALVSARSQDEEVVSQAELEAWTAAIKTDIEALRERTFPRPVSVAVADSAKFKEYVAERMEKSMPPERIAAEETRAKMLGLMPPDMDYVATMDALLESQVGGFYDPETEGFYLMERFGGAIAKVILAHELTHALDDQIWDIDGTLESIEEAGANADAAFAYHAVVEGSGTSLMNVWQLQKMQAGEISMADIAGADMGMEELEDAIPLMWKPLLGAYLRGAAFLNRTDSVMKGQMQAPSLEDIARAFEHPPVSSEQILHPEKYWDEEERDDPVRVVLELDALPEGWQVLHEDTLGELEFGLVVEPLDKRGGLKGMMAPLAARYTFPASEGWGGDRYVLLGNGDARVLLCETIWDSEKDAQEFAQELAKLAEHLEGAANGTAAARGLEGASSTHARDGERVRLVISIGADAGDAERVAAAVKASFGA